MKIQSIATAILSLAASTSTSAFTSTSFRKASVSVSESNTKLFISSWGAKGPPGRYKEEDPNPAQKIQSYLKAPEPIPARSNLDGTILVSGWVNRKDRTDQTIFNFLNEEESAFQFTKIIAFVNDAKFAKKRLISRSARYSGLLDKLDFTQAETEDALPTAAQLEGVTSWVVNAGSSLDTVIAVSKLAAASPDLKNVAVLLTDGQTITDSSAAKDAIDQLSNDSSTTFTVVTVGAITEAPEGQLAYSISDFGNGDEATLLPSNATYSRDESLRVVAECLGLESACNKAMVFTEVQSADVNNTAYKLVKGLREGGYTRPQELHHMIEKGPVVSEYECECEYEYDMNESNRLLYVIIDYWLNVIVLLSSANVNIIFNSERLIRLDINRTILIRFDPIHSYSIDCFVTFETCLKCVMFDTFFHWYLNLFGTYM